MKKCLTFLFILTTAAPVTAGTLTGQEIRDYCEARRALAHLVMSERQKGTDYRVVPDLPEVRAFSTLDYMVEAHISFTFSGPIWSNSDEGPALAAEAYAAREYSECLFESHERRVLIGSQ